MLLSQLAFAWLPTDPKDWIFEIIGIVASLFVFASFFWSNEKITRLVNMVGCAIFIVYSVLIQSLSVCIINSACLILHIVKLIQMRKKAQNDKAQTVDKKTDEETSTDNPPQE